MSKCQDLIIINPLKWMKGKGKDNHKLGQGKILININFCRFAKDKRTKDKFKRTPGPDTYNPRI